MSGIFFDIGLVIVVGGLLCLLARFLKQPLIPAYIMAGLFIGPIFGIITNPETILLLSEIGIVFLLFIVGLEIDLKKLRSVAFVSSVGGFIKFVILFLLGFIVAVWFGLIPLQAVYIGLILSFSSTMVVLKILSDKKELDTLHGRILIGTLLLEDIVAIFALTILTAVNGFSGALLFAAILKGAGLLLVAFLLSKYVFPKLFGWAAENQEVLLLVALAVMFAFSLVFNWLGFSVAIGAFIGGVALGNLFCSLEIMTRVRPLRDFFATIFFVALGMQILINSLWPLLGLIIVVIVIAVVLKPFLVMLITSVFGYRTRPAFQSAVALGQISEFGLIIAAQGLVLGHIGKDIFSLTVVVAVVSIAVTTYLVKFEKELFKFFKKPLHAFENINLTDRHLGYLPGKKLKYETILIGHNRIGYSVVEQFKHKKKKMLIIDFNPEVISMLMRQQIPCLYGDVSDPELLDQLDFKSAKLLISTIPETHTNIMLLRRAKKSNNKIVMFVTASDVKEALRLYDQGADYVIMPHFLGGVHVSSMIKEFNFSSKKILKNKLGHIQELQHRKKLGHEHPRPNR